MSDPETPNQPLIGGQANAAAGQGRSTRAYKVAGITLFAVILIAGQAMVAYFLLSQKGDIKALEEQSNDLKAQLNRGRSVSVPMRIPVNALPALMDVAVDEEASTGTPEKINREATACQLEAAGVGRGPGFRPVCDERGRYRAQQCFRSHCWCVNPDTGDVISDSTRMGPASCSGTVTNARMTKALSLPALEMVN